MQIQDIDKEFARYLVTNFHFQQDAAVFFDVDPSFISKVRRGVKPPTKAMLKEMGVVKKVIFVRE